MKKLFTVAWSVTVEVEVPDHLSNTGVDEFEAFESSKEIQDIASSAVQQASLHINWKDGIITDVEDS